MAIYGIDLGTTFSSAAFVRHGVSEVVALEAGRPVLPSPVLFDGSNGGLQVVVGSPALRRYRALVGEAERAPHDVVLVRGSKNNIGHAEQSLAGPPWRLGEREVTPTDVAAILLRSVGDMIRARPGLPPIDGVVVTHPQRFRNREKLATAQAAQLAGLPLVGMLTEPDAAAWAYGLHSNRVSDASASGQFMVFDFGGGTLDVTLMRRDADRGDGRRRVQAIDSYGVQLGGLAIDRTIRDQLVAQYASVTGDRGFNLAAVNEATAERLLELAEWFKIALNTDAGADPQPLSRVRKKSFTPVFDASAEGETVTLEVTLGDLSRWLSGELDRAIGCAEEALKRASLRWSDIDEVLLTGGSSLLWPLQQRMRERCQRVRLFDDPRHPLNPLTIVASGAALYGASLETPSASAVSVQGVVPDAFSVRAFEPDASAPGGRRAVLVALVKAGTPTPFVGHAAFTWRGHGLTLPVEIFEGRDSREATSIGVYQLSFDRPIADGARVDVRLDVRANGALRVSVEDRQSGTLREAQLDDAPGLYADTVMREKSAWLQSLSPQWEG
ncbi:MAG: Hsp70 family protein [Myxococcales bacterium]|nr:Hsp70 family protein [Myxococcales bacterium]